VRAYDEVGHFSRYISPREHLIGFLFCLWIQEILHHGKKKWSLEPTLDASRARGTGWMASCEIHAPCGTCIEEYTSR
ncbi:mCG145861, partial [Mus musculus]